MLEKTRFYITKNYLCIPQSTHINYFSVIQYFYRIEKYRTVLLDTCEKNVYCYKSDILILNYIIIVEEA